MNIQKNRYEIGKKERILKLPPKEKFYENLNKIFATILKGCLDRKIINIEKNKYPNLSIKEKEEIYIMSEEMDKIGKEMGWFK